MNIKPLMITKVNGKSRREFIDKLAVEAPLEMRLKLGEKVENISITMRTPGEDEELALGFLFTEGLINSIEDVSGVDQLGENIIQIVLVNKFADIDRSRRNFYTSSSCGVCGKTSIDHIKTQPDYRFSSEQKVKTGNILDLPAKLSKEQSIFSSTGGIHAAALFAPDGKFLFLREDVGRHNALDKLIGSALRKDNVPLKQNILLLSGRASFELVQKAAMAGIPVIAAVGAPSSLAVDLAAEYGQTLVGFLKDHCFNIYTGHERIGE